MGNLFKRFNKLFFSFQKSLVVDIIETSPILRNPPFGYIDQPDFYNTIIVLKTNLLPEELLKYLLHVEKIYKRERFFKNAPRTLDLDIIFYDKIRKSKNNLVIPHPHFHQRESVLIPLSYISTGACS